MPDSHLHAADSDRLAVATALGEHMAAGRLTLAEYDERVAHAYAARTFGELAGLTADVPAILTPAVAGPTPAHPSRGRRCAVPSDGVTTTTPGMPGSARP